jgi:hypothetical protein
MELTLPRRDDATTRRLTKKHEDTKGHEESLASHFDGFLPLAAPRCARYAGRMAGAPSAGRAVDNLGLPGNVECSRHEVLAKLIRGLLPSCVFVFFVLARRARHSGARRVVASSRRRIAPPEAP